MKYKILRASAGAPVKAEGYMNKSTNYVFAVGPKYHVVLSSQDQISAYIVNMLRRVESWVLDTLSHDSLWL